MISSRKIKLTIVSDNRDEGYSFIRNEIYNQNKALNVGMSHLYFNFIAKDKIKLIDESFFKKEKELVEYIEKKRDELKKANTDKQKNKLNNTITKSESKLKKLRKDKNKEATDTFKEIIGTSEQTNLRDLITDSYKLYSDTKDRITQKLIQDFSNDIGDVLKGIRSIRNYKKDNPLYVRGRALKIYKEDNEYYIKWIKGIIFKCILGSKKQNSLELQKTLDKIINGKYKLCDSTIGFNNKKIILNLTIDIPTDITIEKTKGRVVGVDLGIAVPAYVALNDMTHIKEGIGSIDDFLRVRLQMQKRRKNLQKSMSMVKGGKGRDKKVKALDSLKNKESNFAKTYNHFISRKVIDFAAKNNAEQINLELLTKDNLDDRILRNWSYYQLQQFIEYKAEREGIVVAYIDPYHTSQTCSECGHYEANQREKQDQFKCGKCDFKTNADYNAARNIAMSNKYISKIEESEFYKKKNSSI